MKLEEIEKLCAEATAGPWGWDWCQDRRNTPSLWRSEGPIVNSEKQALRDAKFLAASHNLVPKLLAVAKAAKDFKNHLCGINCWLPECKINVMFKEALEELEKE